MLEFDAAVVASRIDTAINELLKKHGNLDRIAKAMETSRGNLLNWRGKGPAGPMRGVPFWAIVKLVELTPHSYQWFLGGEDDPDAKEQLTEIRNKLDVVIGHMEIETVGARAREDAKKRPSPAIR